MKKSSKISKNIVDFLREHSVQLNHTTNKSIPIKASKSTLNTERTNFALKKRTSVSKPKFHIR